MPRRSRARSSRPPADPRSRTRTCPEALDDSVAHFLVAVQDGFGVAPGAVRGRGLEARAGASRGCRSRRCRRCGRAVLVAHRLLAAGDVDDRQPAMRKADRPVDQMTLAIGAAVARTSRNAQQSSGVGHGNTSIDARMPAMPHMVEPES